MNVLESFGCGLEVDVRAGKARPAESRRPVVVFGVGGMGRNVHELIEDIVDAGGDFQVIGFLDGNPAVHGTEVHGLPILGDLPWLRAHPNVGVVLGIGSPDVKRKLALQLRDMGVSCPTIIHGTSVIGRRVTLGEGVIVCAGTIITTDAVIEPFVTLNINVTVGEDSVIGEFTTVSPGSHISGNVRIGTGCDIGTGAAIIQGLSIGDWTVVGANAAVVRDLPAHVTAVGIPARIIKGPS